MISASRWRRTSPRQGLALGLGAGVVELRLQRAQHRALEVVGDEERRRLQHQAEAAHHLLALLVVGQASSPQRIAEIAQEQLDGALGHLVGRADLHAGDPHELLHRQPAPEQGEEHADGADIPVGVPQLVADTARAQDA